MKKIGCLVVLASILFLTGRFSIAQDSWTSEQLQVLEAIERLSSATAPGGEGADAYAASLAEDFSRWTVGSKGTANNIEWIEGIREWFDDGWRVSDREIEFLEIRIRDDIAFVRRIVMESYVGPAAEKSTSKAALSEVWVRGTDGWLLLIVNVHPMDIP